MSFHLKTNRKISQFNFDKIFTNSFTKKIKVYHLILAAFMIPGVFAPSFAQESDSAAIIRELKGAVTVTNNGISVIPTFMLGKPAVMLDLAVSGKRLSFEPQMRFAMEGKPWSFVFWWRYKAVKGNKFTFNIGAHPAIAFRETLIPVNGEMRETLIAQRFLAGELMPTFKISPKLSVGLYYLHANGLDKGTTKNTDFLAFNTSLSNIRMVKDISLRLNPQLYLLKMDDLQGYYVTSTFTLSKKEFPLSISSVFNQEIKSTIGSKPFVWNVSLVYAFDRNYSAK